MKANYWNKYHIILFLIFISTSTGIAQCNTSKDYINNHYDSTRADFSKEFFNPVSENYRNLNNIVGHFKNLNCSPIWLGEVGREGILGNNYWRIQFVIMSAEKDKHEPSLYHIIGKSKLRDTITDFSGTIKILAAYENNSDPSEIDSNTHGYLYSEYYFQQDNKLSNAGIFKGTTESDYIMDTIHKQLISDTLNGVGDDYYSNDNFVGVWKNYKTNETLKCIWGDSRLPFTFDFDIGDGDMSPNPRYKINGWQTYPDDTWITNSDGNTVPIKWWLKK